ncbi:MAG: SLC13 family permease [Deltaproteobacteria bacterium]|nr:SLC13 family permease [Deltaproteobacteria bacterium]
MEHISLLELGWQAWVTIALVVSILGVLVCTRLPSDYVFLGGLGILLLSGILDPSEAFAGFGSQGVVTVAVLYIVVAGLKDTGGLSWISRHVLGHPKSYRAAQLRLMLPVCGLSAFLNNTPVVALFIPAVTDWCRRIRVQPSRLLIPLSYASIFGGVCTLVGTSTNLVVNGMVQTRYGSTGLHMFEITKIGLPVAVVGVVFVLALSRLLPSRRAFDEIVSDPREYTLELRVTPGGSIENKTIEAAGLRQLPGAFLADVIRDDRIITAVAPDEVLRADDRLVFVGNVDSLKTLYGYQDLYPASDQIFKLDTPRHERCLVEAVVSNTCPLVGKSIREGRFRERYNAVVVAVARNGERVQGRLGDIVLRPGDTLLVEAHAGFIPRQKDSRDFYLVSEVGDSSPLRFEKAPVAFAILSVMVTVAAFGWLSMLKAALLAAALMLITGCCSHASARRSIEWDVLLTIAAALGLGLALEKTGAANALAGSLLGVAGSNPWIVLAMVYLATSICTEVITNNAAAVLVFPIAMYTAEQLGVSSMPFIMCIMVAASASFATPIGYQTNLMVYGPGGYRFGDYLRIGIPLNLTIGCVSVALAPLIWPFSG